MACATPASLVTLKAIMCMLILTIASHVILAVHGLDFCNERTITHSIPMSDRGESDGGSDVIVIPDETGQNLIVCSIMFNTDSVNGFSGNSTMVRSVYNKNDGKLVSHNVSIIGKPLNEFFDKVVFVDGTHGLFLVYTKAGRDPIYYRPCGYCNCTETLHNDVTSLSDPREIILPGSNFQGIHHGFAGTKTTSSALLFAVVWLDQQPGSNGDDLYVVRCVSPLCSAGGSGIWSTNLITHWGTGIALSALSIVPLPGDDRNVFVSVLDSTSTHNVLHAIWCDTSDGCLSANPRWTSNAGSGTGGTYQNVSVVNEAFAGFPTPTQAGTRLTCTAETDIASSCSLYDPTSGARRLIGFVRNVPAFSGFVTSNNGTERVQSYLSWGDVRGTFKYGAIGGDRARFSMCKASMQCQDSDADTYALRVSDANVLHMDASGMSFVEAETLRGLGPIPGVMYVVASLAAVFSRNEYVLTTCVHCDGDLGGCDLPSYDPRGGNSDESGSNGFATAVAILFGGAFGAVLLWYCYRRYQLYLEEKKWDDNDNESVASSISSTSSDGLSLASYNSGVSSAADDDGFRSKAGGDPGDDLERGEGRGGGRVRKINPVRHSTSRTKSRSAKRASRSKASSFKGGLAWRRKQQVKASPLAQHKVSAEDDSFFSTFAERTTEKQLKEYFKRLRKYRDQSVPCKMLLRHLDVQQRADGSQSPQFDLLCRGRNAQKWLLRLLEPVLDSASVGDDLAQSNVTSSVTSSAGTGLMHVVLLILVDIHCQQILSGNDASGVQHTVDFFRNLDEDGGKWRWPLSSEACVRVVLQVLTSRLRALCDAAGRAISGDVSGVVAFCGIVEDFVLWDSRNGGGRKAYIHAGPLGGFLDGVLASEAAALLKQMAGGGQTSSVTSVATMATTATLPDDSDPLTTVFESLSRVLSGDSHAVKACVRACHRCDPVRYLDVEGVLAKAVARNERTQTVARKSTGKSSKRNKHTPKKRKSGSSSNAGSLPVVSMTHLPEANEMDKSDAAALRKQFLPENLIGTGSFGAVYKCVHRGDTVAVKVVHCKDEASFREFETEIMVQYVMRSPKLLPVLGYFRQPPDVLLVLEYMPRGSLEDVLRAEKRGEIKRLSVRARMDIAVEIARALVFLHTNKPPICHRDVKLQNVLVDDKMRIKLCDFGFSEAAYDGAGPTRAAGTMLYLAPEAVGVLVAASIREDEEEKGIVPKKEEGERLDSDLLAAEQLKQDVYAWGVVVCELFCGVLKAPWGEYSMMALLTAHTQQRRRVIDDELGQRMPSGLRKLAQRCLENNHRDRPSSQELLSKLVRLQKSLGKAQKKRK